MVVLPDGQQGEEIGIGMRETPVRRVGFFPQIHRPLARVLNAQRRRNDQHLPQRLFAARLQNHAADGRIHWQARQFAADPGQGA